MIEILNELLLAGDNFKPEIHLTLIWYMGVGRCFYPSLFLLVFP